LTTRPELCEVVIKGFFAHTNFVGSLLQAHALVIPVGVVVAIVKAAPLGYFFDHISNGTLFCLWVLFRRLCHVVLGDLRTSTSFLEVRIIIGILACGRRLAFFYWDLLFFIFILE
jgi:hypothetical protein